MRSMIVMALALAWYLAGRLALTSIRPEFHILVVGGFWDWISGVVFGFALRHLWSNGGGRAKIQG